MKCLALLFSLLCVNALAGIAQSHQYQTGFIILEQDTLPGYLELDDDIQLSHAVSFKESLASEMPKTYSPRELKGFGFKQSKQFYSSVEVNISESAEPKVENRFAKILLLGDIQLYKLELSSKEKTSIFLKNNLHLYIVQKEGRFYTLGQYEHDLGTRIRHEKKYIGVLKALLNDCLNSSKDITEKLEFTDDAITQLIQKYNNCKNPEVVQSIHSEKIKPIIKHGISASFTKIYTSYENVADNQGYSIGYFWDRERPSRSRTTSESFGINYLYLHYTNFYYTKPTWNKPRERVELPRAMHFIRIPVQAQLMFNNQEGAKMIPFISGGLTGQFSTDNGLNYLDIIPFINVGAGVYIKQLKIFTTVENMGFSYKSDKLMNLGIGIRLDRVKPAINP